MRSSKYSRGKFVSEEEIPASRRQSRVKSMQLLFSRLYFSAASVSRYAKAIGPYSCLQSYDPLCQPTARNSKCNKADFEHSKYVLEARFGTVGSKVKNVEDGQQCQQECLREE